MEEEDKQQTVKVPGWVAAIVLLIVVVVLLGALYLQFIRYNLVNKAIDLDDQTTSALLLSPEIATGLSYLLG